MVGYFCHYTVYRTAPTRDGSGWLEWPTMVLRPTRRRMDPATWMRLMSGEDKLSWRSQACSLTLSWPRVCNQGPARGIRATRICPIPAPRITSSSLGARFCARPEPEQSLRLGPSIAVPEARQSLRHRIVTGIKARHAGVLTFETPACPVRLVPCRLPRPSFRHPGLNQP